MKNKILKKVALGIIILLSAAFLFSPPVWAQWWTGNISPDWEEGGNWDGGVPNEFSDAYIGAYPYPEYNPVIYAGVNAYAGTLVLDSSSQLDIHGSLTVSYPTWTGMMITGGSTVNQYGNSVVTVMPGETDEDLNVWSSGATYNLYGGQLTTNNLRLISTGAGGGAVFNQSAGTTVTINNRIQLGFEPEGGYERYNLEGGTLSVRGEISGYSIFNDSFFDLKGGVLSADYIAVNNFNWTAGTLKGADSSSGFYGNLTVPAAGILSAGASPGDYTVSGALTIKGILDLELASLLSYDRIFANSIVLDGAILRLIPYLGFSPAPGNVWSDIFNFTSSYTPTSFTIDASAFGTPNDQWALLAPSGGKVGLQFNGPTGEIPEPSTILMSIFGFLPVAFRWMKRRLGKG